MRNSYVGNYEASRVTMKIGVRTLGYAKVALAACGVIVLSCTLARATDHTLKSPVIEYTPRPMHENVRKMIERESRMTREEIEAERETERAVRAAREARERRFDDCILEHLAKARTETAVKLLAKACRNRTK